MQIIIKGDRSEGKSTLALMVEAFLRQNTPYEVTRDDDLPASIDRTEQVLASDLPSYTQRCGGLKPRRVAIRVDNAR